MTSTARESGAKHKSAAVRYQMFIDGRFLDSGSGKSFEVFDPATVPLGSAADVDAAAQAASKAFYGGWRTVTAQDRGRVLFRLAARIRERRAELAELETRNTGKPLAESEYDMDDTATCFEYYGGLATKINGEVLPVPADAVAFAMREPMGVAGQIIPWNYPLMMAAWKIAPALAAGCTVVLKPAEQTPLSVLRLCEDLAAVGLPIMRGAAEGLKRVSLELGGKSPNIFFADADFENAVDGALFGVFVNQGEVCSAGSRVLVQRDIYQKFVDAAAAKAKTIKLGNGLDRETKMGPLVSAEQRDRVREYLRIGAGEAKVAAG